MNRSLLSLAPLTALALLACNKDKGEQRSDADRGASLQRFDSCEELRGYVADTWTEYLVQSRYGYYGYAEDDVASGGDSEDGGGESPTDYSQTNVQEAGVDEPDLVKTDGEHLYIVQNGELSIVDSWPADETALVATLPLEQYPFAAFLSGDRLAVFSHYYDDSGYYDEGDGETSDSADFRSGYAARVTVIDVSDRSAPEVLREVDIEGWYTDARMVGSDIYVVVQAWTNVPSDVWNLAYDETLGLPEVDWDASEEERQAAQEEARAILAPHVTAAVNALGEDELLPRYRDQLPGEDAELTGLLACTDLYRTQNLSWPSVLTLAHLDLDEGDAGSVVSATGVMADGWTVYASTEGLYVAQTSSGWWTWDGSVPETTTQIHRFALDESGSAYEASGEVPGWLLNQFSLSEHEGDLRVATSDGWGWGWAVGGDVAVSEEADADAKDEDLPANNVFVLRQEEASLETIGELRGIAPEEQIYAARFLGEKGYLVTFEQIDPLFTIDLSDPTAPTLVGELKVPGYSSYLHPIGEDHLLAVGMDGTEDGSITGFAVSLFDVSDFAAPVRAAQLTADSDEWSWSEALYDHHAFTFHDGVLSVPLYTYSYDAETGDWESFSGLWVIAVDEQAGTLTELGRVDHADLVADSECLYEEWYGCEEYYWYASMRRSVVIEDGLYSLSDYGLKVSELRSPDEELARVLFHPAE